MLRDATFFDVISDAFDAEHVGLSSGQVPHPSAHLLFSGPLSLNLQALGHVFDGSRQGRPAAARPKHVFHGALRGGCSGFGGVGRPATKCFAGSGGGNDDNVHGSNKR